MSTPGVLKLRDRSFAVKRAKVGFSGSLWWLEIETERVEYDGEWWEPRLYHQGLRLMATTASELAGTSVSWAKPHTPEYAHPEIGAMYVFGHHLVENARIDFGACVAGKLELKWRGSADVCWDEPFGELVPFECECRANVEPG